MTDREVMQMALEALEAVHTDFVCRATHHKKKDQHGGLDICPNATRHITAITALRAALEQPEQEPVAWWHKKSDTFTSGSLISHFTDWLPLYTTPPQRKLLTGEQIEFAWMKAMQSTPGTTLPIHEFARAIEQAHDIKETP